MSAHNEVHRCYEIEYSGSLPELRGESFPYLVSIEESMRIVRQLRLRDEEPAERVLRDYETRLGMVYRSPADLMRQIDQWLRMISRYVAGNVVITPHDTAQVWGGAVESEDEFLHVAGGVLVLAGKLIRAYEKRFSRERVKEILALSELQSSDRPGWDWNDGEDMVARIADAPVLENREPKEQPSLNAHQRDLARTHFSWGHDLTEIADHLGLDFDAVWFEHMTWRVEQMITRGPINEDGSDS